MKLYGDLSDGVAESFYTSEKKKNNAKQNQRKNSRKKIFTNIKKKKNISS